MNSSESTVDSGETGALPRQQNQTIEATATQVTPSFGLYQPSFPLTDGDFERLQKVSPALTAIGGSVLSFGLSYGIPVFVKVFRVASDKRAWPVDDLYISGGLCLLGVVLLLAARFFSRERYRVMRKIRDHFKQNPGQHEIREDRR